MAYETEKAKEVPESRARKGSGRMPDHELRAVLDSLITDAAKYVEDDLTPKRAKATDYYHGRPFGNEEEGRSQVVMTEVRDGVRAVIPSLLRVFFGAERVVEFAPRTADDVEGAQQATDYVQHVFAEDNPGFMETLSVLKDGLVRKLGIFKWGWDDTETVTTQRVEGVTPSELEALVAEDGVDLDGVEEVKPATPEAEAVYNAELIRRDKDGRAWVRAVPTEEFLIDRNAPNPDDATFVGHRTRKTRGELLAMGIPESVIDEHGGDDTRLKDNEEAIARRVSGSAGSDEEAEAGEANEKILYVEAYPRIDYDGDGIAELRKICTIGPGYHPVKNEPCDHRNFAVFCPDPEPHTAIGQSWADLLMDMQLVKSSLVRGSLDSLAASIFPRVAYLDGQVSLQDLLNNEIGAPIREKVQGAVRPFTHEFVGREALPLIALMDDTIERRTGRNKAAAGLDADALQSTTKSAADAAVSASKEQAEFLARVFAEGTLKPLFRGLLRLLVENQPKERVVRLRNKWVPIDPRKWNANMDVQVVVALGAGLEETKLATLTATIAEQKEILATLGPQNPVVSLHQYSKTLRRALELRGYKNVDDFFTEVPADWQPPPQPPQPSPEEAAMQIQLQIEQIKAQGRQQELQLKAAEAERAHQLEIEKMLIEAELKRIELELKYKTEVDKAQLDAAVKTNKAQLDAAVKREVAAENADVQREQIAHTQAIAEEKAERESESE